MRRVVVYDACVLHPAPLRDLLIRLSRAGLVQARWSETILDECFRSIVRRRPELEKPLQRTREVMSAAVPDSLVTGHEGLIASLVLPDPDDRHVLAAAIHAGADTIVTANLSDFPPAALAEYGVEAKHPDRFVVELIDSDPDVVLVTVVRQAADLKNPRRTVEEVLGMLRTNGLEVAVERLLALLSE